MSGDPHTGAVSAASADKKTAVSETKGRADEIVSRPSGSGETDGGSVFSSSEDPSKTSMQRASWSSTTSDNANILVDDVLFRGNELSDTIKTVGPPGEEEWSTFFQPVKQKMTMPDTSILDYNGKESIGARRPSSGSIGDAVVSSVEGDAGLSTQLGNLSLKYKGASTYSNLPPKAPVITPPIITVLPVQ
jgi:hypothetical protein